MDNEFIVRQVQEIETGIRAKSLDIEDRRIWTILEYLNSLLKPEEYSTQKKEDLRRLVLEIGYDETIEFQGWMKKSKD